MAERGLEGRRRGLDEHSVVATLVAPGDGTRCTACAHRCVFTEDGRRGICGVRFRREGTLRAPFGYVARRHVRSVETNTLFHVLPGARALTFGLFGCDLHCAYCHNWRLSQALRDAQAPEPEVALLSAEALVAEALAAGCEVVCAAYNEPMIAAEWVHAVFAVAQRSGLVTAVVTDGHSTPEALLYLKPVTDVFRVDLKGFEEEHYRALGGRLKPVLDSLSRAKELGYWVEVVTLVVPSFNDDPRGLRKLAAMLAEIDPEMPWHLNAFQPRYAMKDRPAMSAAALFSAAGTAYARGLSYVYVNNVENPALSSTRCPRCHALLIERREYETARNLLVNGACPACARPVSGRFIPQLIAPERR